MTKIVLQKVLNDMFIGKYLILNGKKFPMPIEGVSLYFADRDDEVRIALDMDRMYADFKISDEITVE